MATRRRARTVDADRPRRVCLDRRELARRPPASARDLRAARRHVHAGRDVRGCRRTSGRLDRSRHHRRRTDARRGLSRRAQLGLRRCRPLRALGTVRPPGRPARADRSRARPRTRRAARRRLQPPGPRRSVRRGVDADDLHRPSRISVGTRHQFRRAWLRARASADLRQRPALAARVPPGRLADRRHPLPRR